MYAEDTLPFEDLQWISYEEKASWRSSIERRPSKSFFMGEKFSQILFILRPFEDTLIFDDLISIDQFLRLVEGHLWRENVVNILHREEYS